MNDRIDHSNIIIRTETPADYRAVESLTREAFWNRYCPGCTEHYLVHKMRKHPDYLPALSLVLEREGQVIASIHYTRARLIDEEGREKPILSFGPIGVLPALQRKGYGKALIAASFERAAADGHEAVVILGNPDNYVGSGFRSCRKYGVGMEGGVFPTALMVHELKEGALKGHRWVFRDSNVYEVCEDEAAVAAFDAGFPPKVKW